MKAHGQKAYTYQNLGTYLTQSKKYTVLVALIVAPGGFVWGFDATVISGAVPFSAQSDRALPGNTAGAAARVGFQEAGRTTGRRGVVHAAKPGGGAVVPAVCAGGRGFEVVELVRYGQRLKAEG